MGSKTKTKVVFMGGNLLGCTILRYLLRMKDVKVLLVVGCYQDNGSIVEPRVWNASLARLALNKMLPFIQPKSPHNLQFINDIQKLDRPDYIITAEYDKILDPKILAIPEIGSLNIHFSNLPEHKGSSPVIWSVLENAQAGITLHWLDDKINSGDIINSVSLPITSEDTSFSVYSKLSKKGMEMFKSEFPKILAGTSNRKSQNESESSYHAAGYPEQRMIDWNKPGELIDRFIRALTFPGFESARTFYHDMEVSILHPVEIISDYKNKKQYEPGTIININSDGLIVKTKDNAILIKLIKINQSMPIDAYKLGRLFDIKVGEKFRSFDQLATGNRLNLIVP